MIIGSNSVNVIQLEIFRSSNFNFTVIIVVCHCHIAYPQYGASCRCHEAFGFCNNTSCPWLEFPHLSPLCRQIERCCEGKKKYECEQNKETILIFSSTCIRLQTTFRFFFVVRFSTFVMCVCASQRESCRTLYDVAVVIRYLTPSRSYHHTQQHAPTSNENIFSFVYETQTLY